jgi:hypothetical protein
MICDDHFPSTFSPDLDQAANGPDQLRKGLVRSAAAITWSQAAPSIYRCGVNGVQPGSELDRSAQSFYPAGMRWAFMSKYQKMKALAAGALLLGLSLGGWAMSTTGSLRMDARAEAPTRPKTNGYLPVEDLPPKRQKPAMTAEERLKLEKDLTAARDHQASRVKARGRAAGPQP